MGELAALFDTAQAQSVGIDSTGQQRSATREERRRERDLDLVEQSRISELPGDVAPADCCQRSGCSSRPSCSSTQW